MPTDATPSEILSNEAVEALHARAQKQAQAQLETLLKKHSVPRARRHLLAQYPVKAIPMTARKVKADLVVMGAVSRSGLKRLFIGNTAENLINELGCDILIVKPPKFASGVPRAPRGMQFLNPQPPMGFV
jgi:universal stress protein E